MEVIHDAPTLSSYTPLSEHQSQTPASFYTGPAVLHHHSPAAFLVTQQSDLSSCPALARLLDTPRPATNGAHAQGNAAEEVSEDEQVVIPDVEIWVTSECDNFPFHSITQTLPTHHKHTCANPAPENSFSTAHPLTQDSPSPTPASRCTPSNVSLTPPPPPTQKSKVSTCKSPHPTASTTTTQTAPSP